MGGKTMERADLRFFKLAERERGALDDLLGRQPVSTAKEPDERLIRVIREFAQLPSEPLLHLRRGLVGEG